MALCKNNLPGRSSVQKMCIMAYLGDLKTKTYDKRDEIVLCTLELIDDCYLRVTPDFNDQAEEPYLIYGRTGTYYYTVQDVSEVIEKQDESKGAKAKVDLSRSSELRLSYDFDIPAEGCLRIFLLGEIESAVNFEYSNLFIEYCLEIPKGWASQTDKRFGVTQLSSTTYVPKAGMVAYFGMPLEFELMLDLKHYKVSDEHPEWPLLFIAVMSMDSLSRYRLEGYGYVELPRAPGFVTQNLRIPHMAGTGAFPRYPRVLPLPKSQRPIDLRDFLMSHMFHTGIDINRGHDKIIDGFLNIRNPVDPKKLWDLKGFIQATANHLYYHWGHLVRPVNRYNLTEAAVAQLSLNPFLRRLRGMTQKRPLLVLPKDYIPIRCKPPVCNPYIHTVALALEFARGNDFALNGLIDFPVKTYDPDVELRFPLGGTMLGKHIPIRVVYGHHLSAINPFGRIWEKQKEMLTENDCASKQCSKV
ncbi:B9-C2 domain containing protein [Trichuris trichiura]|uniref:B9-C2 domain containing protein n=1 Tax=Trichuris trichiura TaxID=36087 RepID=A0A077ZF88_TRITR|nr:B9-C2 domain containing protein [Trichuris trichiura]